MKVSIIIPVYNVAPYVEECVRSVMNQTMTKDMECIIVDDCGTDNSMEIVERLIVGYKGNIEFRILHHEHNRGPSAARNTGIGIAKGKYIYFLDSDDWIIPECMELMLSSVRVHPDAEMVFAGADVTDNKFPWLDYTKKRLPEYSGDAMWLQKSMLMRYNFGMTPWNKLIARRFIRDNKLCFKEGLIHEDELWNLEISKHIKAAAFVSRNTYYYRINNNGITAVSRDVKMQRLFKLWNIMIDSINGRQSLFQAKALSNFILKETTNVFHSVSGKQLAVLFFRLALKSSVQLALYITQGILALTKCPRYRNGRITPRITLH